MDDLDWYDVHCDTDRLNEQQFDDPQWPEKMPCHHCKPVDGVMRKVLGEGPITNRADPTQTHRLECGHLAI